MSTSAQDFNSSKYFTFIFQNSKMHNTILIFQRISAQSAILIDETLKNWLLKRPIDTFVLYFRISSILLG